MLVSQVNIYPIKSCAGISLDAAEIGARGFVNDRRWLVVDEDWSFLTQREIKEMALIKTAVDAECLHLSAPNSGGFDLPVDQDGERVAVTIWKDSGVGAVDQGDAIAGWLSDSLKQRVRLVRFADDYTRQVDQTYALRASDQVGFADAYPFLFISEASLADLNERLDEPLPMNRFRPNIVVKDTEAYAEDHWKTIRVGEVIFDVVKSCARCAITTTDQATAERGKEPLRTLAMYRQGPKGSPLFGQNAAHRSRGTIKTGMAVEVLEYRNE
ncbi:MAG: MOSC domain-containing protein [Chloroflexi bacterium]|nr:MOSC domain-containing protein [Chloroflexota bacterium]